MSIRLNQIWQIIKKIAPSFLIVLISLILFNFIKDIYLVSFKGYIWKEWTGFGDYLGPFTRDQRGKTLWDWLELLIIPLFLAGGAWWFTSQEKKREIQINEDRQRENILSDYLDRMTNLLVNENILKVKNKDKTIIEVAQARTIAALRELDTNRKNILFQFLRDANLNNVILVGASLEKFHFERVNLKGINLHKTNLIKANFTKANLFCTNMSEADLEEANFNFSTLEFTNLNHADVRGSHWKGTIIKNSYFDGANLEGAFITNDQLASIALSEKTTLPDGSKYDGRFDKTNVEGQEKEKSQDVG